MQRCNDCRFASTYMREKNICINKFSLNFGKIVSVGKEACSDFSKGKCSIVLHPNYLWCETCKKTIYPDFEIDEHIKHELYIDRDIENILEYANLILSAAD